MAVDIAEYDPHWPEQAAQAVAEPTDALPGLFRNAEHVGSTFVPGLASKPVIDLMASVPNLEDVTSDREEALERLGCRLQETGMPGRLFYRRQRASEGSVTTCTSSLPTPGRCETSGSSATTFGHILKWRPSTAR